jgi:hypothetical protein
MMITRMLPLTIARAAFLLRMFFGFGGASCSMY